jgi:hypothetical protein
MDASPISAYDPRLIQIQTYNLGDSIRVGSNGLRVDNFNYNWPALNYVGFAFNQDLWESSYMCGSCPTTSDLRTFTVDG